MEGKRIFFQLLSENEKRILKDLFYHEPDCAKFISRRLHIDLKETIEGLKLLENLGIIERVFSTFVKKGKIVKHRNHTYYEIKKDWRNLLKIIYLERGKDDTGI